jgi:hypothetical protein
MPVIADSYITGFFRQELIQGKFIGYAGQVHT